MVARPILGSIALFFLAGGLLLHWFLVLSGGVNSAPENRFYFLQASTGGIANTRNPSRWTFWAICGVDDAGHNANCGSPVPALPFDPPRNFGTQNNVPESFIGTKTYYYLSRFMFAFYLISFFFAHIALFTGLLALFSRLGGYLSALTTFVALFFQVIAAALMTAWVAKGRDAWRSAGFESKIGTILMAFAWATFACYLLSSILFCLGGTTGRESSGVRRKRSTHSTRSRGSFLDTESQRRVKDNYS
ncbi:SUR7-domain-containing protein [Bimuria novae-zelandiae CBS 107.79]|uniref:SUR7-domain-containing protein n=1 Tax=Bimuria novae-zelandiae CBS 107.79 TaxID=1447943 RepID=A0A6A5UPY2_9PLEO|nr:SUR7-domain-containing protein [Bimuria novae-zelandiae CBS 107.79]